MTDRSRVLSGIQPTADSFHLGNYLGALRNWVALQETHDAFYCLVDLHALTINPEPTELRRRVRACAAQLLAMGIDPQRSPLFAQSDVPEHAQLAWLLQTITWYGEASRMTQFKDKSLKGGLEATSVGIFTYPMLQAADILLYQPDLVPVGEDQRQHIELTRDLATRFNNRFGQTFVLPQGFIPKSAGRIVDLQNPTGKMSKSTATENSLVNILDTPSQMTKKIKSAVTDSIGVISFDPAGQPGIANLLTILGALTGRDAVEVALDYEGKGYGILKGDVADAVVAIFEPIGQRTREILDDPAELDRTLADGAARARSVAGPTYQAAASAMGLGPAPARV